MMRRILLGVGCGFLCMMVASAQSDNARSIDLAPGVASVRTLEQNWTDEESNWFYNAPQGSRLIPYDWFVHLEQPDSTNLFRAAEHIRSLGYIARKSSSDNPDALPIGFVKDAPYDDGLSGLGVTCAACHTAQIRFADTAYIVDGAPTMGDMESFMRRLVEALEQTLNEDEKFDRFARAVLGSGSTPTRQSKLRDRLKSVAQQRRAYNERNFPSQTSHRFGHGRVDAFGAIFNEVSTTFLGIAENVKPASAPVSYPCLWDAPQHDSVQWNGAAKNRTSKLGLPLFGTKLVGALGRNTGEVLGVFGHAEINRKEFILPRSYESTANKRNLLKIEATLTTLWSPLWPEEFGQLDRDRVKRGAVLYRDHCKSCHKPIDRDAPGRKVKAQISDEQTDPMMLRNFGRTAKTGMLKGRKKTLLGTDRFADEEPIGLILKHVVERVMLNSMPLAKLEVALAAKFKDANELNPGYQNTAIVQLNEEVFRVPVDRLTQLEDSIVIEGSKTAVLKMASSVHKKIKKVEKKKSRLKSFRIAREKLGGLVDFSRSRDDDSSSQVTVENANATFGYKARPLNGIWATAPYLHNGSVPTLVELLKPADERVKRFHVGSQEFDPVHVGFVDDDSYPIYDTSIPGNFNTGHEHGAHLSDEERMDLVEYLKSL